MARAYPYRTPSVDEDDGMSCARISPRVDALGIVPYGAIAAGAQAAGVLKPKFVKPAGAVASAATGAKVGSAFGPIGTAIGAIVGAAAGLLGGKKIARSEQAWDAYKRVAGSQPGRAWPAREWELAFEGMWKTNNKRLAGVNRTYPSREPFKEWVVNAIAKDFLAGKINGDMSAEQIAQISVFPEMDRLGASYKDYAAMKAIFVDLVDRIITAQPFARYQVTGIGGGNQPKIATLSEVLERLAPTPPAPSSTGPTVPVPADAVPPGVAPPAIAAPAPLPAGATSADVTSAVKQIADALLATQQGQALSTSAQTDAVNAAALEWLRSQGVPTSSPKVQDTVAKASTASVASAGSNWLIPALAVGGMIAIASTKNGGRRRRRRK